VSKLRLESFLLSGKLPKAIPGKPKREIRTPESYAWGVLSILCREYGKWLPDREPEDFLREVLIPQWKSSSTDGDKLLSDIDDLVSELDKVAGPGEPLAIAYIASAYCAQALKAQKGGSNAMAWTYAIDATYYASLLQMGTHGLEQAQEGVSSKARRAALLGHQASPAGNAKRIIRECWEAWNVCPGQYKSTAAFARAMLDKFPDELSSQPVIERWVRDWRRGVD
jgi:hypothetical protein